jgi:hypothetical protein
MHLSIQSEKVDMKGTAKREGGEGKPDLKYAWYVLAILTGMYRFSFVDRQILSLLVPSIKRDLGVSDTQIGFFRACRSHCFILSWGCPSGE